MKLPLSRLRAAFVLLALAICLTMVPTPSPAKADTYPVPMPCSTRLDVAVRKQMVASNSPWLPYLLQCASDPTGQFGIENQGTAAAYATLYTGNPTYATNAWSAIKPWAIAGKLPGGDNNNSIRISFGLYAICYRILRPTLAPADRQLYIAWMNGIAQRARSGFLTSNANGLIGEYLGLCLWSLISAPDNPAAATMLTGTWHDFDGAKPYGGLDYDPTLGVRGSARNAIYDYVTTSYPPGSGSGAWLEGTQYINASLEPLLLYTLAINQVSGQDHFPEVTAALPQIARNIIGILSNNLTDEFQFGDDEFPHDLHIANTLCTASMLARRLIGTSDGAQLAGLINWWAAPKSAGGAGFGYKDYACRMYLAMDPYAPASDWRVTHPPLNGSGLCVWRSGWSNTSDSVFGVNTDPMSGVNHTAPDEVFRSFRLYRNGEWAIDHPISYGGMGVYADGNNTVVAGGIGVMHQHGVTAVEDGPNYCYQRSETSGNAYPAGYYRPPASYIAEQTGSVLYVHGANKTADVVIVADRVSATAPGLSGWRPWDLLRTENAVNSIFPYGPLQWILHCPVAPAVGNGTIAWDTPGSQHVVSQDLDGNPATAELVNEAALDGSGNYAYFNYGSVIPTQRKYQVRETISDGKPWHFLLHAITVYDGAIGPTVTPVRVSNASVSVSGALVEPGNEAGVLAIFGSDPSGRVIGTSFSVGFSTGNKETDVYLPDLDTGRAWTAYEDARPGQAVVFGAGGVGRVTYYQNRGSHSLTLIPN